MVSKVIASFKLLPPPSHRVWVCLPPLVFVASLFRVCPRCVFVVPFVWVFARAAVVSRCHPIPVCASVAADIKFCQSFCLRVDLWRSAGPPPLSTLRFVDEER